MMGCNNSDSQYCSFTSGTDNNNHKKKTPTHSWALIVMGNVLPQSYFVKNKVGSNRALIYSSVTHFTVDHKDVVIEHRAARQHHSRVVFPTLSHAIDRVMGQNSLSKMCIIRD